jgi:hypothetical protein
MFLRQARHGYALPLILISVFVFGTSMVLAWVSDLHLLHQHLGGEYYNIARALADGRGFSDPFGERTGPTAWMPPLLPAMLAALLWVTGSLSRTASIIVVMNDLTLVVVGMTIWAIATIEAKRLSRWVAVTFYGAWLFVFRYWTFKLTHDVWLLMLATDALTIAAYAASRAGRIAPWIWGILGGLLSLSSPALTLAWLCLSGVSLIRARGPRRDWMWAAVLATCIATPWLVRNVLVFDRFIPTKSNFFYDAYVVNYEDDDGLYDVKIQAKHPLVSPSARLEYARLGEIAFVDRYRRQFIAEVKTHPGRLIRVIGNRLLATTVWYPIVDPRSETPEELPLRRLIYMLPFVTLLLSQTFRGSHSQILSVLGAIVVAYLLPYVFVGFYVRYLLPLTPPLVLLFFLACDRIAESLAVRLGTLVHSRRHGTGVV